MSTTLYLIRHGESEGNRRRAFLGHWDLPLTEKGREQAQRTAAFLADQKPDVIYSSDLLRAYQTAEATATLLGMPIGKEPLLREIFAGEWENLLFDDIMKTYPESYRVWQEDIGNARPNGGESVLELQRRVTEVITRLAEKHDNQTMFLFTHATSIRVFTAHVLGKSQEEIGEIPWASNASVSIFSYDGSKFTLIEYGKDDFMGDVSTRLPSNV